MAERYLVLEQAGEGRYGADTYTIAYVPAEITKQSEVHPINLFDTPQRSVAQAGMRYP